MRRHTYSSAAVRRHPRSRHRYGHGALHEPRGGAPYAAATTRPEFPRRAPFTSSSWRHVPIVIYCFPTSDDRAADGGRVRRQDRRCIQSGAPVKRHRGQLQSPRAMHLSRATELGPRASSDAPQPRAWTSITMKTRPAHYVIVSESSTRPERQTR